MATKITDTSNEMFQLAIQLVNYSSRNLFLTGKAGTGKTTFLKYIRENCLKQMAVVAPTGVAAINAGGVTIHSFFQLPVSPFIPGPVKPFETSDGVTNKHALLSRLRINTEKRKVLQALELLIIDEVSMVRCDTMDAMDTVLRHVRQKPDQVFGGVQVLFIGDMLQLPPVIKDQEWSLLNSYYSSPYFFDSQVIRQDPPLYVEFNKIYRQSEEKFIRLLNEVRSNQLDEDGMATLESLFKPKFRRSKQDGYIILTTHNEKARQINANELQQLEGELHSFQAETNGEFSEKAYPADEILYLKKGAQVMFLKNDNDKSRRYFNGKIGIISRLEKDKIFVRPRDESEEIEIKKEKWDNIRYTLNSSSRQLEDEVLGSFSQYPLRLAWAITIHKSQGLTFEKAIIDAGGAFAPGQVYVALSRCTTLEGMVLESRINRSSLAIDERITSFANSRVSVHQLNNELVESKRLFLEASLISIFDFLSLIDAVKSFIDQASETELDERDGNVEDNDWEQELVRRLESNQETARSFQGRLKSLFANPNRKEANDALQERLKAAADYFGVRLKELVIFLQKSAAKQSRKMSGWEYKQGVKELFSQLAFKKFLFEYKGDWLDLDSVNQRKRSFAVPSLGIHSSPPNEGLNHQRPDLFETLKLVREGFSRVKNVPSYFVANNRSLNEMARYLPQTPEELVKIDGLGEARVRDYGYDFLVAIREYTIRNNLSSLIHEKPKGHEKKEVKRRTRDTKAESYTLYKEGKSAKDIATYRNLSMQTIETHLAHYVGLGLIPIDEMISYEKQTVISKTIGQLGNASLSSIKQKLDSSIKYADIQFVRAWLTYQQGQSINDRDQSIHHE